MLMGVQVYVVVQGVMMVVPMRVSVAVIVSAMSMKVGKLIRRRSVIPSC
jgi:hypothetical protein